MFLTRVGISGCCRGASAATAMRFEGRICSDFWCFCSCRVSRSAVFLFVNPPLIPLLPSLGTCFSPCRLVSKLISLHTLCSGACFDAPAQSFTFNFPGKLQQFNFSGFFFFCLLFFWLHFWKTQRSDLKFQAFLVRFVENPAT